MKKFIDLDGTLLDLWPRYHRVFCELLHIKDITLGEYKKKKQDLGQDNAVAEAFGYTLPPDYFIKKAELLEDKSFLSLDRLFLSRQQIEALSEDSDSIILTKRRKSDNLVWQMGRMGLNMPVIIVEGQTKLQWIKENYPGKRAVVVGDSMMDLETGRLPNISVIMTGYGLGTKKQFDSISIPYTYVNAPDEMVGHLRHALEADREGRAGGARWNFEI